jgi:hypothetical protein
MLLDPNEVSLPNSPPLSAATSKNARSSRPLSATTQNAVSPKSIKTPLPDAGTSRTAEPSEPQLSAKVARSVNESATPPPGPPKEAAGVQSPKSVVQTPKSTVQTPKSAKSTQSPKESLQAPAAADQQSTTRTAGLAAAQSFNDNESATHRDTSTRESTPIQKILPPIPMPHQEADEVETPKIQNGFRWVFWEK